MRLFIQSLALASTFTITATTFAQGRLVGINSTGVYEISMANGSVTQISTLAAGSGTIGGLAYDSANGILYMCSTQNQNLMTLNPDTGAWNVVGSYGLSANPIMHGLEYNPDDGRLYAHSGSSSFGYYLYDVSTTNGSATLIGQSSLTSFHNLGYDSTNDIMYLTNSNTDSLYTVDLSNNVTTLVGSLVNATNPNGLAYNHDTGVMYMLDNSTDNLYTLNLQTGEATVVGSMGSANFLSLVYLPAVPAPGALAVLGMALLGAKRRRR
jgi:DNA-binding beta-propeller fold protein YncE